MPGLPSASRPTVFALLFLLAASAPVLADVVETHPYDRTMLRVSLVTPWGAQDVIQLSGHAVLEEVFEGTVAGDAADDDANGRDEIETRLLSLSLSGYSALFGTVQMTLRTGIPSQGSLEEEINDVSGRLDLDPFNPGFAADSFFDVFFQIDFAGMELVNSQATRLLGQVNENPTGMGDVLQALSSTQLFDLDGNPTEYLLSLSECILLPAVEVDAFEHSRMILELGFPLGAETIVLNGPATVETYFDGDSLGSANDDDGDLREEVVTALVGLDLYGYSGVVGAVRLNIQPDPASLGEIEEQVNSQAGRLDLPPFATAGSAVSFFDVQFVIEFEGQVLHTIAPYHISGVISYKPTGPGEILAGLYPVELYDAAGAATGIFLRVVEYALNPVVEIDTFDQVSADIVLIYPNGEAEDVSLTGHSVINVFFEGPTPGAAVDNDANGLDEVDTEMVSLDLTGSSPTWGPLNLNLLPDVLSRGQLAEQVNDVPGSLDLAPFNSGGFRADSFFDIQIELDVGAWVFTTAQPVHVAGVVAYKPAGPDDVLASLDFVDLLDDSGQQSGFRISVSSLCFGRLVSGVGDNAPRPVDGPALTSAPNPFNPHVSIFFRLQTPGHVTLEIFDTRGRMVTTLLNGAVPAGDQIIMWDGQDRSARSVASGVYHLLLRTEEGNTTRKIVLVR